MDTSAFILVIILILIGLIISGHFLSKFFIPEEEYDGSIDQLKRLINDNPDTILDLHQNTRRIEYIRNQISISEHMDLINKATEKIRDNRVKLKSILDVIKDK